MNRWWVPLLALMLLVVAVSVGAQAVPTGTVEGTVNLRAAPDTRANIVRQVAAGETVSLTGRDPVGRWLRVETNDALDGWLPVYAIISDANLQALPVILNSATAADAAVQIEAFGRVNVRTAPTVNADIVGQLEGGEMLPVLGRDGQANDWLLIALPGSPAVQGWVAWFTVGVQGDPSTLPVLAVDAADEVLLPEALVNTRFNARLHREPALDSPTLAVVPFEAQVVPLARTADGAWLYVSFGESIGWGAARLFELPRSRALLLPVFVPTSPEATPEVTVQPEG